MTATREHDEVLLEALDLMNNGFPLSRAARVLRRDSSNLGKALRAVLREDLESGDDPYDVVAAYPTTLIIERRI